MYFSRVECRDANILLTDEHANFCAAQYDAVGALREQLIDLGEKDRL